MIMIEYRDALDNILGATERNTVPLNISYDVNINIVRCYPGDNIP